ncbi:MAG: oligosaccharide flippase family protein [Lentisphaeria bacterium]|nr:oligosaccharide flippase family protein [Lentisphaeria bacterium]
MKIFRTFITGSLITFAGNGILGLVNYFTRRTMVTQLTGEEYGLFWGAFSMVSIATAFADLGIVNAGVVLIAEKEDAKRDVFSALLILKLLTGLAVCALFVAARNKIAEYYLGGNGALMVAALGGFSVFFFLSKACESYCFGNKRYFPWSAFGCVTAGMVLSLMILCGRSAVRAAVIYMLAYAIILPVQIGWVCRDGNFGLTAKVPAAIFRKIFSLIGVLAVMNSIQVLLFNIDSVLITFLIGPRETAVYNVAQPITHLLLSVLAFSSVFLPIAVDLVEQSEYRQIVKYMSWGLVMTLTALPVLFLTLIRWGRELIAFFFNSSSYVEEAALVLPWLMCGYLMFAFGSFVTQTLIAMREKVLLLVIASGTAGCDLLIICPLIRMYHARGAAIATCIAYGIFAISSYAVFLGRSLKRGRLVKLS